MSPAAGQAQGPPGFGQLAGRSPILPQRVRRRIFERHFVGLVAKLLEIAHERFQPLGIAAVDRQDPSRTGLERA